MLFPNRLMLFHRLFSLSLVHIHTERIILCFNILEKYNPYPKPFRSLEEKEIHRIWERGRRGYIKRREREREWKERYCFSTIFTTNSYESFFTFFNTFSGIFHNWIIGILCSFNTAFLPPLSLKNEISLFSEIKRNFYLLRVVLFFTVFLRPCFSFSFVLCKRISFICSLSLSLT